MRFIKYFALAVTAGLVLGLGVGNVAAEQETVTIKKDDTLWSIAQQFNVSVTDLENLNPGIQAKYLQVGSSLIVKNDSPQEVTHIVKAGDTLFSIAKQYDVTVSYLNSLNPGIKARYLQIGSEIIIEPKDTLHVVIPGDTLYHIANIYPGVSLQDLYDLNQGIDPFNLQVGQTIVVSKGDANEYHQVRRGDTFFNIANRYNGVRLQDLYQLNPDIDPLFLQVGSSLRIR